MDFVQIETFIQPKNKLKIEKTTKTFGMLILSSVVLWLIKLIPYVGSIVGLIAGIIGLGIVTMSLLKKDKIKETDKNTDKNKDVK